MKKLMSFMILTAVIVSPAVFAQEMAKSMPMGETGREGMMKMYQCPMDGYTSEKAGTCPMCGMTLEEKKMTAAEAEAALEKQKA